MSMEITSPNKDGVNPSTYGATYTASPSSAQATANMTALDQAATVAVAAGSYVSITGMLGINDEFELPARLKVAGTGFYWGGTLATSSGSCIFDAGVADYGALVRWGTSTQTEPHWYSRMERLGLFSANTTVEVLSIRSRWVGTGDYDSTRKGVLSEVWIIGGNVQLRWGPDPTPSPYAAAHATATYYSAHRFVTSGGRQYRCVRTGASGGVAPTFPTVQYETVTETNIAGLTARADTTAYAVGDIRRNTGSDRVFICKIAGTSAGSAPATYATASVGDEVADGSVTWLRVNLAKWEDRGATATSRWEEQSDDFIFDGCYFNGWTVADRANSTAYALGDRVKDASGTDRVYQCTVAGTTTSPVPAAIATASMGDTVADGTVTWTRIEAATGSLGGVVINGANAADAATWRNCGFSGCSAENEAYVFIRGGFLNFEQCYAGGDGTNTRVFVRLFSDAPVNIKVLQSEKMYATFQVPFDGESGYLFAIKFEGTIFDDEVHILKSRRVVSRGSYYNTVSAGSPTGSRLVLGAGIRYQGEEDYFYDDRQVTIGASSFFVNKRSAAAGTDAVYQQNELIWRLGTFAVGQPMWYAVTQQGRADATTRANTTAYALNDYVQNAGGDYAFKITTAGTTAAAEPGGVTVPTIGTAYADGTAVLTCVNTTPILTATANL